MNEFESAKGDFEKVLEVNPQNKAARLQISMCQKKAKEHNERDRRIYANMFKKFAEQDAKVCAEPTCFSGRSRTGLAPEVVRHSARDRWII